MLYMMLILNKVLKLCLSRLGVATLNGKIYACGGYDGSSFLRSVECFDPHTHKYALTPFRSAKTEDVHCT